MAWRRPGDKPLSEPMMVSLLAHICVTLPQWVNGGVVYWRMHASRSLDELTCASRHFRKYRLRNNRRQQRDPSERVKPPLHPDENYGVGREYTQTKPQPLLSYQDKIEENEYAYVDEIPQILASAQAQNTLNKQRDMSDYRGPKIHFPHGGGTLGNRRVSHGKGDMIPQYFVLDPETGATRHCADTVNNDDYLYEKQRCKMHRPVADPRDINRSSCRTNTLPR